MIPSRKDHSPRPAGTTRKPLSLPALAGLFLAAVLVLTGCKPSTPLPSEPEPGEVFVPPTLSAKTPEAASQAPLATISGGTPAAATVTGTPHQPDCTNGLTFLRDLSIPDGTPVSPGAMLDKRWSLQNSGTCNWEESYSVRLILGPDLGAAAEQALYPARSGTSITLRLVFTAPDEPGAYRSAWQAFDPQGNPFGDPFFIEINVITKVEEG